MSAPSARRVGLSAFRRANDLSDFGDELDMIERLDVDAVEILLDDLDVVVGGNIRQPQLDQLKTGLRRPGLRLFRAWRPRH